MIRQIPIHLLDQLGIMRAVLVQPEHRRRSGRLGAIHRQLHPVLDRGILHLAHAPDVAFFHLVLQQRLPGCIDDAHRAVARRLEGLVVRAVFFRRLRHQTDVGHAPHGLGSSAPCFLQNSTTS